MYTVIERDTGQVRYMDGNDKIYSDCPNLKVKELACKDGSKTLLVSRRTCLMFQRLRVLCGSLTVNSAFRNYQHNLSCGGAKNSQHLNGGAMDIKTPKNLTDTQFADLCDTTCGYLSGVGVYKGRVHIDDRLGHARWDNR